MRLSRPGSLMGFIWSALFVVVGVAKGQVTKADIDPYVGKIASRYVYGTSADKASIVSNGRTWVSQFDLGSGRFKDLADSYLIPLTGTKFGGPIPDTIALTENAACLQHLERLRAIAIALKNGWWKNADTVAQATAILVAGMNYWTKVNPYGYVESNGQLRYHYYLKNATTAVKITPTTLPVGSYTKMMGHDSYVRDVLLASRSLVGASNSVTSADLAKWSVAILDTSDADLAPGWANQGTYNNGVNWWWRLNARVVRDWALGFYDRCDALIKAARDSVGLVLVPAGGSNYRSSGVRPDGTFNQHGIPYNGQYGKGGFDEMNLFGEAVDAMPKYAIGAAGWQFLTDYALDGVMRLSYRGIYDPDVLGRYFTQRYLGSDKGASGYAGKLTGLAKHGYRVADLGAAASWVGGGAFPWPSNPVKAFPCGDIASWLRSDAAVFWRGTSNRLTRTESYNSGDGTGNDLAFAQGMGTHWILAHDGAQYFGGLLAVMDYTLYPGVTADSLAVPPSLGALTSSGTGVPSTGGGRIYGTRSFVGSMSDGTYAIAAQDYDMAFQNGSVDKGDFVAKKALFILDSMVVSLNAGLKFGDGQSVRTGVNKLRHRGDFLVARGAAGSAPAVLAPVASPKRNRISGTDIRWAWHDSVGYVFASNPHAPVTVTSDNRSAPTSRVGWTDGKTVTEDVASLWISHGKTNHVAAGDTFSYAFFPGISRARFSQIADDARAGKLWTVDSNTTTEQAISLPVKKWHGAVFHGPDTISTRDGFRYGVSRPCVAAWKITADSAILTVADPAQGTDPVAIVVGLQLKGAVWSAATKLSSINVPLSVNPDSVGATVRLAFALPTTSAAISTAARNPAARVVPGVGILVTAPEGAWRLFSRDAAGREFGSWDVVVGASGQFLVPVSDALLQGRILSVSR